MVILQRGGTRSALTAALEREALSLVRLRHRAHVLPHEDRAGRKQPAVTFTYKP